MALFVAKDAPPAGGGLELLRQAARSRKMGLAALAREIGVGTHQLDAFIAGGTLPNDKLDALAALIFGSAGVTYDASVDLLRRAPPPEVPPFGTVRLDPWDSSQHPPVDREIRTLAPVEGAKPPPDPRRRPGWA